MKTNLQAVRKAAGYKSAKAFAEHMGMSVGTYTQYEQGQISLSLEKAWEFADALDCSLDELAGRKRPRKFGDPMQSALNESYENMNSHGRETLVSVARSLEKDTANRIEKDGQEHADGQAAAGA